MEHAEVEPYSVVEVKDMGRGGTTRGRGRREVRAGAVRGENEVRVNGGQRERGTSSRRNGPQEQNRWNMLRHEASGTVSRPEPNENAPVLLLTQY